MAWNPIIVDGGSPFRIRYPKEFTATYEYVPTNEREYTSTDQHVGIKKITVEKVFDKEYKKHNKLTFHTDDETEQEVAQA